MTEKNNDNYLELDIDCPVEDVTAGGAYGQLPSYYNLDIYDPVKRTQEAAKIHNDKMMRESGMNQCLPRDNSFLDDMLSDIKGLDDKLKVKD